MKLGDLVPPLRILAFSDEPTRMAADKLAESDADSLPIVDPSDSSKAVGLFTRVDAFRARVIWFKDESVRERHLSVSSWVSRLTKGSPDVED